jgi:hypothetical protein
MKDMDILNFWKSIFVMGIMGGASFGVLLIVMSIFGALKGMYAVCGLAIVIASALVSFPVFDIFDRMEDSINRDSLRHSH